jgi:outer membrane lipoprotein-sorting protein
MSSVRARAPLGCLLLSVFVSGCVFALALIAAACLIVAHLL